MPVRRVLTAERGTAGEVDDDPALRLPGEGGHRGAAEDRRSDEVDGERQVPDPDPFVERAVELGRRVDPGVVDEDVDPAVDRDRVRPQATGRDRVGEVGDDGVGPGANLLGEPLDRVRPHVVDEDGPTGAGQGTSRRGADAAARPRDENDAAVEIDHVLSPLGRWLESEA